MYKNLVGRAVLACAATFSFCLPTLAQKPAAQPLKIGFVYVAPLSDAGWVRQHDEGRKAIEAALPASDGAVTDLSHARLVLRLEGDAVVPTLAKGVMIDLDPGVFPPGALAQTVLHAMDVLLLRHAADVFDIAVFRGFGMSLAEWLADAAQEFGVAFER